MQVTAILLLVYFAYLLARGVRNAEWGFLTSLGVLSVVDRHTLDLSTLSEIQLTPAAIGFLLLTLSAFARRSTARLMLATLGFMVALAYAFSDTQFAAFQGYLPIHLTALLLMLSGFVFRDPLGQWIRQNVSTILAVAATLSILAYRFLFPDYLTAWHAIYALCCGGIVWLAWKSNNRLKDFLSILLCGGISFCHLAEHYLRANPILTYLPGRDWIVWGTGFLLLGLLVSFAKGGQLSRWYRTIQQWHMAIEQTPKGQP